jgi:hypothetical protein
MPQNIAEKRMGEDARMGLQAPFFVSVREV